MQALLLICKCPHGAIHVIQVVKSTRQRWRKATADVPKVGHTLTSQAHVFVCTLLIIVLPGGPHATPAPLLQDPWGRLVWLWDRPPVKRVRLTISMAQWSVRLPALLALIATQVRSHTLPIPWLLLLLRMLSYATCTQAHC